jgi:hypothetical protein
MLPPNAERGFLSSFGVPEMSAVTRVGTRQ